MIKDKDRAALAREHAESEGDNGNAEVSFLAGYEAGRESLRAELSRPSEGKHAPRVWLLRQRENGKWKTFWSFDGAPSDAYTPLCALSELEEARAELEEARLYFKGEGDGYAESIEALCKQCGVKSIQDIANKLASQEESLRRMREALEFYADGANWFEGDNDECRSICRSDLFELSPNNWGGGRLARAALAAEQADGATSAEPRGEEKC